MSRELDTWLNSQRNEIYIDDKPYTYIQKYDESTYIDDIDTYSDSDNCSDSDSIESEDPNTNLYECDILFRQMIDYANDMNMEIDIPNVNDIGMIDDIVSKNIFDKDMRESFYRFIKNNSL